MNYDQMLLVLLRLKLLMNKYDNPTAVVENQCCDWDDQVKSIVNQ